MSLTSYQSSSSNVSVDTRADVNAKNISSVRHEKRVTWCEQLLFVGPLVLSVLLLICGIIVFVYVGRQHNKHHDEEIFLPEIIPPFHSTLNGRFLCLQIAIRSEMSFFF
jgi:hypothetical protein